MMNRLKIFSKVSAVVFTIASAAACNGLLQPEHPRPVLNIKPVFSKNTSVEPSTKSSDRTDTLAAQTMTLNDGTSIELNVTRNDHWPVAAPFGDTVLTKGAVYSDAAAYEAKPFRLSAWNATQSNAVLFSGKEYTCDAQHNWSTAQPPTWLISSDNLAFVGVWDYDESATASIVSGKYAVNNWDVSGNYADQKDLRVAFATYPADHNGDVLLYFNPYMNAIRVKVGEIPAGYKVTEVSLKGVGVKGTLVLPDSYTPAPQATGRDTYVGDWGNVTTGNLTLKGDWASGASVTPEGTAFLIIDPDGGTVAGTIEVTFSDSSGQTETKSADLSALGSQVYCGESFTITIGYDPTIYVFKIDGYNSESSMYFSNTVKMSYKNTLSPEDRRCRIQSYSYPASNPDSKTALSFSVDYSTHPGGPFVPENLWHPFDSEAADAVGISGLAATSNSGSADWLVETITAAHRTDTYQDFKWKDDATPVSDLDLSYTSIGGEGANSSQNTANCYIVHHPGTYKFPCVYGNAIQNGMPNAGTYTSSVTGQYVLGALLNANGTGINSPYVLEDVPGANAKAALLWCDTKKNGDLLIKNVSLSGSGSEAYISFETASKADMCPGNALIVLYDDGRVNSNDAYDEGEALWSWHIWVTDADLSASNVGEVGSDVGPYGHHYFISQNLGASFAKFRFEAQNENMCLRLRQNDSGNTVFILILRPDVEEEYFSNTFYKGNSKNPQVGCKGVNTKPFYGPDGNPLTILTYTPPQLQIGESLVDMGRSLIVKSVTSPMTFITGNEYGYWYLNLWAINNADYYYNYSDIEVDKTVYDPSPYGYRIPSAEAFRYFTTSGEGETESSKINGEWGLLGQHGMRFKNSDGELDDNLFFQVSGFRYSDSYMWNNGIWGCYWAVEPHSTGDGYSLYIHYYDNEVNPLRPYFSSLAFSVRPVLETD